MGMSFCSCSHQTEHEPEPHPTSLRVQQASSIRYNITSLQPWAVWSPWPYVQKPLHLLHLPSLFLELSSTCRCTMSSVNWPQDEPSFLWKNLMAAHASHLKNNFLCQQQEASLLLTDRSQQLQGALYVPALLPDILSQYTSSLTPLLPRSLPISKSCHTAKH